MERNQSNLEKILKCLVIKVGGTGVAKKDPSSLDCYSLAEITIQTIPLILPSLWIDYEPFYDAVSLPGILKLQK